MFRRASQSAKKFVEKTVVIITLEEVGSPMVVEVEFVVDKVQFVGPNPNNWPCNENLTLVFQFAERAIGSQLTISFVERDKILQPVVL